MIYRPTPTPASATPFAKAYVLIANLIPAGMWSAYGQLGDAIEGGSGRGASTSLGSVTPLYTADTFDVDNELPWCWPLHRVRLWTGRVESRAAGSCIPERLAFCDRLYADEGGTFAEPGVAHPDRQFDIARKVAELTATGLWKLP